MQHISLRNSPQGYSSTLIALHWLMLVLIVAVYACIELRTFFPRGSDPRETLKMWHFMLGLSVLFLASIRLVVRIMAGPAPDIVPPPNVWQHRLAKTVHVFLYLFMLGMPIAGWVILSASGKPIPFFGLELPPLTGENKDLSTKVKEVHELVGLAGYFLIGLHAAAALVHHYLFRDNTLKRMLKNGRQG